MQTEWRTHVIADLHEDEKVLYQQRQESEERIERFKQQRQEDLNKLQQCFLNLSMEEQHNEEIQSFNDLDQYHKRSSEAIIRLSKEIKPMPVEGNHIAVLGWTSRGKSTMINSLLGKTEAAVGIGEVTTKCEPYKGLNFVLWDTPGRNDETKFNGESIALWKSMRYRLILIENTIKENSRMMKLFDQIDLHYEIIVNKFDLVDKEEQSQFREQIRHEVRTLGLQRVNSIFFLSAKFTERFSDWLKLVDYLTSSVH